MGQTRDITLRIFEHPIKVTIEADQEEAYRRAEKELNAKLREYANAYTQIGREVLLCVVALEEMMNRHKIEGDLGKLEERIDSVLSQEE